MQGPVLQVWRGGEDIWMPPGGASISTAAAADGIAVASCTHFKVRPSIPDPVQTKPDIHDARPAARACLCVSVDVLSG